jgi:hypothetical protein
MNEITILSEGEEEDRIEGIVDNYEESTTVELDSSFISTDGIDVQEEGQNWNLGYVEAVSKAIKFILDFNQNLFSSDEIEVFQLLIGNDLSLNGKRLLCRLLFRKTKWMKVDSFKFYLQNRKSNSSQADHADTAASQGSDGNFLQESLDELLRYQVLITLSKDMTFRDAWKIAVQLLTLEEWHNLYKQMFNHAIKLPIASTKSVEGDSKGTTTSSSSLPSQTNKKDVIEYIRKTLTTQRNFFGYSLKDKFASFLITFFQKQKQFVALPVSLSYRISTLLRRAKRLYQVKSPLDHLIEFS